MLALLAAKTVSVVCSKCGSIKKSGKLNCCARGGAWFKNCGAAGDSNAGHTWVEGLQACNSSTSLAVQILGLLVHGGVYCVLNVNLLRIYAVTISRTAFCPFFMHSND